MAKKKARAKKHTGFDIDIHINEFGELEHSFDIDKINAFLNETTDDWRLKADNEDKKPPYSKEEE
jgi:hypothetical protein